MRSPGIFRVAGGAADAGAAPEPRPCGCSCGRGGLRRRFGSMGGKRPLSARGRETWRRHRPCGGCVLSSGGQRHGERGHTGRPERRAHTGSVRSPRRQEHADRGGPGWKRPADLQRTRARPGEGAGGEPGAHGRAQRRCDQRLPGRTLCALAGVLRRAALRRALLRRGHVPSGAGFPHGVEKRIACGLCEASGGDPRPRGGARAPRRTAGVFHLHLQPE